MRRIAGLIVLFLFVVQVASASDEKRPSAATKADPEILTMTAEEIFAFVEQTLKDPKADRVEAQAFLQKVLNREVRMLEVETALTGPTKCLAVKCKAKSCARCDLRGKCACSTCCIALQ